MPVPSLLFALQLCRGKGVFESVLSSCCKLRVLMLDTGSHSFKFYFKDFGYD